MKLSRALLLIVLAFLLGMILGTLQGYDHGAKDQAVLDALSSKEGREHLEAEELHQFLHTGHDWEGKVIR